MSIFESVFPLKINFYRVQELKPQCHGIRSKICQLKTMRRKHSISIFARIHITSIIPIISKPIVWIYTIHNLKIDDQIDLKGFFFLI